MSKPTPDYEIMFRGAVSALQDACERYKKLIKEAIYRLKNTAWLGTDKERAETEQAVDMAIEALSAEYEDYEHATLVDIKEPLKVAVVRCKDCIHYDQAWDKRGACFSSKGVFGILNNDDDYCSYGERREP